MTQLQPAVMQSPNTLNQIVMYVTQLMPAAKQSMPAIMQSPHALKQNVMYVTQLMPAGKQSLANMKQLHASLL